MDVKDLKCIWGSFPSFEICIIKLLLYLEKHKCIIQIFF